MDARAHQRLLSLTHVLAGELDVGDASYLGLTTRQMERPAGACGLTEPKDRLASRRTQVPPR